MHCYLEEKVSCPNQEVFLLQKKRHIKLLQVLDTSKDTHKLKNPKTIKKKKKTQKKNSMCSSLPAPTPGLTGFFLITLLRKH